MTNSVFQCANCGAPLASANAICPRCEPEFSAPDKHTGKYRCPDCACRFDQPDIAIWPSNAKWYRPQIQKAKCPHCQTLLRDRTVIQRSRTEMALMLAIIVASAFSTWRPGTQIILLAVLLVSEFLRKQAAAKSLVIEEDRYVSDQSGK
ncbi:hypothetical protein ACO0LM_27350 [Undibacterium sp. Di26W]|uniref:hypothetical protein n=1 Tax=Undibacterium sp. Di26W TaxID=3413035 RepID=UPI003BF31F2B